MNIGKVIKYARTKRGLTQTDLASQADLSVSYLSLLERNKRDPGVAVVARIAVALRVPMFLLIAGAEILSGDELEQIVGGGIVEKLAKELLDTLKRDNKC